MKINKPPYGVETPEAVTQACGVMDNGRSLLLDKQTKGETGTGIGSRFRKILATGYFHLVISLVCVQGLIYLSQFIIARLVGPQAFGIVRSVEAIIGVAVIVGSAGMPSLIVKSVAEEQDASLRGAILRRFAQVALLVGAVAALLVSAFGIFFVPQEARGYLWSLAGVTAVTACSRTVLNYFQGIRQFQRISVVNLALSALSVGLLTVSVRTWGLHGWVASRYCGELLFLLGGYLLVRKAICSTSPLPGRYDFMAVVPTGMTLSLSLLVRAVIDNMGLFILGYLAQPPEVVGWFGMGALIVTGAGVIPGAAISIMLPRLAEVQRQSACGAWGFYLQNLCYITSVTLSLSLLIAFVSPILMWMMGAEFAPAVQFLNILLVCIPLRSLTSLSGAYLVVLDQAKITLQMNAVIVAAGMVSLPWTIGNYGVGGLAWMTVLLDLLSSTLYIYCCYTSSRRCIPACDLGI